MEELLGKKITGLFVNADDQETLMFLAGDEKIVYQGYADCCSETWFADITGVEALIGGTISSVESVEMPNVDDDRCRQEVDEFYGYKLTTEKGYVDIVYRNSSNGYYGGCCSLIEDCPENMVEITEDWSA